MSRPDRSSRRRVARPRLLLDGLEARQLCTVGVASSVLAVVSAQPAPGAELATPPGVLSVTFSRPLLSGSLGSDLQLKRVADDGSASTTSLGPFESLDEGGTTLRATLPEGSLTPGHYQLVLSATNALVGEGDAMTAGEEQVVSDFVVASPAASGVRLADAIDLGTLGSSTTPTAAAGSLDLAAEPGAVKLYRVTLPAGRPWRLGAEVALPDGGDSLDSILSLFDSGGRPISTAGVGQSGIPRDPYLFAALAPGTYYLGVSGRGNQPGEPGGYDPSTGVAGSSGAGQAGGRFQILVVAEALGGPTTVLSSSLDQADPRGAAPTGLTLRFSGALGSIRDAAGRPGASPALIDQDGKAWPFQFSAYDASTASLSLIFGEALPAGRYTLAQPEQGGLVDLVGRSPVAPGRPAGVLASFDVAPAAANGDPLDLGPLFPASATAGISREFDVTPGEPTSVRFVVLEGGVYELQSDSGGSPVSIQVGGSEARPSRDLDGTSHTYTFSPGVYTLTFRTGGSGGAHVDFSIRSLMDQVEFESFAFNGLGQGSALGLRLIESTAADASTAGPSATPSEPAARGASPLATSAGMAGLYLSPGGVAVGQIRAGSSHVEAVGPAAPGGSPAIAAGGVGLLQGIHYNFAVPGHPFAGTPPINTVDRGDGGETQTDGAIAALGTAELTPVSILAEVGPAGQEEAGWLDRVLEALAQWVAPASSGPEVPADLAADVVQAVAHAEAMGDEGAPERPEVEEAGFGSYLGMGLAAILSAHCGRGLRGRPGRGRLAARSASRRAVRPLRPPGRPHRLG